MDKPTKDAIRELVLNLRGKLEAEIERELGRYGIYADRACIPAHELPRLTEKERDEDRPRLEAAIRREQDAGLSQAEAVRAFIRETAYTHMNRLLGLKCLEVRGLITETITTRPIYSDRSQRHRDYLDEHPEAHRAPDRGLMAMLQEAYTEASQQIGVVFAPDSDYSIAWPRPADLKECIDRINRLDVEVARRRGEDPQATSSVYADDTILGWVYQYFQEEEKKRVFYQVSKKKKKISGDDIIPATTAYTERYMVQFLVENSLGALWMEMYPDSDLCERWAYFVEDPNLRKEDGTRQRGREPRPVAELTLLDPAGGSGHFLLYAFDLFARMYEAEAQMQGRLVERAEIARRILRHNLYGIDIDLRSVQLSALNLYMKACTYAEVRLAELQDGGSVQMNLVCADIVLRRGPQLKELLDRFKEDPLTQDLIETLWGGLENARELGSLLKVEEQVDAVIARKREVERGTFWEHPDEAWGLWKQDFLDTLKDYVDRAAESFDVNWRMFGQEAIKGVQLLDLLTRRYDVVTTNPPYMGTGNLSEVSRDTLALLYPVTKSDLYTAFIERCMGFCRGDGFTSMVTQHTFMFLRTHEKLRELLLRSATIRVLAHLGAGAFGEISGEVVNSVLFVLRNVQRQNYRSAFLRLVDADDKATALSQCLGEHPQFDSAGFVINQSEFHAVAGVPFVYWAPPRVFELFGNESSLTSILEPRFGINTGNNARFIRYTWEVDKRRIGPDAKWTMVSKGGGSTRFYGALDFVVAYDESEMRKYSGSRIFNTGYFYREALVFSHVGTSGLSVRYVPEGFVFEGGGSGIFPLQPQHGILMAALAYLNSSLAKYLIEFINPTLNFQVGDLARLPWVSPTDSELESLRALAEECIAVRRANLRHDITSGEFENTWMAQYTDQGSIQAAYHYVLRAKDRLSIRTLVAEGLIDELVFRIYAIDGGTRQAILREIGTPPAFRPVLSNHKAVPDDLIPISCEYLDALPHIELTSEELVALKQKLEQLYVKEGRTIQEISTELGISPTSVVALRRELGLINPADLKHEVENLLTHRIWELCKRDEDGIIPYDTGLRNPSLLEQVQGEIEAIFGTERAVEIEAEMDEIMGRGGLAGWLGNPFFRKHKSQFKSRPILWQITSPDQNFRALVYYHKLDHDTLPKLRSQYLWPLLERARTQLRAVQEQNPFDLKAIGDLEAYIADLEECDRRLESVIQGAVEVDLPEWANGPYRGGQAPYHPDLDDGVKVNILPLQAAGLLPMKKVV